MEANCSHGGFDFQRSMKDLLPNDTNQRQHQACVHHNNIERGKKKKKKKSSTSENESNKTKRNSSLKWIDKMVKLMITALSYLSDEDDDSSGLQKKSCKWRSVSKAMEERGFHVSPQQCEDKFNDLYKRYKKLNEMLGRGTSCDVVENPSLLDKISFLNEKEKDEIRKIMSSKHLFYEEMCSYHNGNRLHLPHDFALQRSLHLITLTNHDDDADDGALGGSLKRLRRSQSHEEFGYGSGLQKQWIESKSVVLEEQKLRIQGEMMELERQRIKWEMFSKKRDQKLEKMRMENEKMRLENEKMRLELKRVELGN